MTKSIREQLGELVDVISLAGGRVADAAESIADSFEELVAITAEVAADVAELSRKIPHWRSLSDPKACVHCGDSRQGHEGNCIDAEGHSLLRTSYETNDFGGSGE